MNDSPGWETEHLKQLPLVEALWWFIENVSSEDSRAPALFFLLRDRYRNEHQQTKSS